MILVKNGQIINPATQISLKADMLIEEGIIKAIGTDVYEDTNEKGEMQIIDAEGMIVIPGLVDVHVHFRDPGFTHKEDIITGAKAAAKGGFTTVVLMANTKPPVDNTENLQSILEKGKKTGIHVESCANVTVGMAGHDLVDMAELAAAGAVGFSDDGMPLTDERIVRQAMQQSLLLRKPLSFHEEDPTLIHNNGINAGIASSAFGIAGSPREAEITMIKRDIGLAHETGAVISIQHISTAEGVELVRAARAAGYNIHAEATPHHFTLTEDAVLRLGTLAKMNPPLRTESDRMAIIKGLQDGTIDIIATDHAPHTQAEKEQAITDAPSGIIGLETALSLGIRELVQKGYLTIMELIERMSTAPAQLYHLPAGDISPGQKADVVIFSPDKIHRVGKFASKSNNSPFIGEDLPGVVYMTICDGEIVYHNTADF
ncbi:MAG: dihydroorotase [Lachnospiraceae bacterium]|nr:dihydroorotase [Lachnospiraceae bacterium]